MNSKYWGGASSNSPIIAYLGAEEPIDNSPESMGFLNENAASFKALLVYIEHRYYGKSVPFGSRDEALQNASTIGYFNSAQALADYASVIIHIKKTLNAPKSPVIVVGASYGGMLASWFRLKYPHITIGALASSAPILYFDDITPQNSYYDIVSKNFREASLTCFQTIQRSWSEIDRAGYQPNGMNFLSQRFNTCRPLTSSQELKSYLQSLFTVAAQYNDPARNPVSVICGGIDRGSYGSDVLSKIYSGLVALRGDGICFVNPPSTTVSETAEGWGWQTCSEIVFPIGIGSNSIFPTRPFNLNNFINSCKQRYDVSPRPHWVTTYYGGHSIKLILNKFGSNIIFYNGLRDPYSSGGVLEDLSDSLVAIQAADGSHCLDLVPQNLTSDPKWLVDLRNKEVSIIKGWIAQYYVDLQTLGSTKLSINDENKLFSMK